ncbi:hypothetical protein ACT691_11760, partial [Vibrio metschnikovii]
LENLDSTTRDYMRSEVNIDFENNSVYYSKYLKSGLEDSWDDMLLKAVTEHDDVWLEKQVETKQLLVDTLPEEKAYGWFHYGQSSYTAPQTLAEGDLTASIAAACALEQ